MIIKMLQFSILVFLVVGCKDSSQREGTDGITKHLNVEEAKKVIEEKSDLIIIDVRTPEEWSDGSLPGTINIDVKASDFESKVNELDKSRTYLVHCRSGKRSTKAVGIMEKYGFTDIYHLDGGYLAWTKK